MEIRKGQRLPLASLVTADSAVYGFQIGIQLTGMGTSVDFACFGLNAQQKQSDDRCMIFYNQPISPCGAVELSSTVGDNAGFVCRLNTLPDAIDRLVFTAAVDGPGLMRQLQSGYLRIVVDGKGQALYVHLLNEIPSWLKEAKNRRIIN